MYFDLRVRTVGTGTLENVTLGLEVVAHLVDVLDWGLVLHVDCWLFLWVFVLNVPNASSVLNRLFTALLVPNTTPIHSIASWPSVD